MKKIFYCLVVAVCFVAWNRTASAQEARGPVWVAELESGTYAVRLDSVSSVSIHEFLVDGAARVREVVIATDSPVVARFYQIEPFLPSSPAGAGQSILHAARQKAEEVMGRVGADEALRVVNKSHPATTHAKTVEYRLASQEDLQKLFDHIRRHWINGQGGTFTLQ